MARLGTIYGSAIRVYSLTTSFIRIEANSRKTDWRQSISGPFLRKGGHRGTGVLKSLSGYSEAHLCMQTNDERCERFSRAATA